MRIWICLSSLIPALLAAETVVVNTPGNLEATMPLDCVSLDAVTGEHTPADIYPGVLRCVQTGQYLAGIRLLHVATAFGRFDQLRVTDVSAHEAMNMLRFQLGSVVTAEQQEGWAAAFEAGGHMEAACAKLLRLGPPTYYPHYMIQHGLHATAPWNDDPPIVPDFDPRAQWAAIMDAYECAAKASAAEPPAPTGRGSGVGPSDGETGGGAAAPARTAPESQTARTVTFRNKSEFYIWELYFDEDWRESWTDDMLREEVLGPDEELSLTHGEHCLWDIRVVLGDDGGDFQFGDIDLCDRAEIEFTCEGKNCRVTRASPPAGLR